MNPLMAQFLSEAREFLQGIAEKLMHLEQQPDSANIMNELFRLVHTLKGNSGLFEFPEMTRVLHAGEDLLDAVRDGQVQYSQVLADRLLDAMDFVNSLVDEIEAQGRIGTDHGQTAARLAETLRQFLQLNTGNTGIVNEFDNIIPPELGLNNSSAVINTSLLEIPETKRMDIFRQVLGGKLSMLQYSPEEECFFKGEDPFYQVRQIPQILWFNVDSREPWPAALELDAYRCILRFKVLTLATEQVLHELFRYIPEQINTFSIPAIALALPDGEASNPIDERLINELFKLLETNDLDKLTKSLTKQLETSLPKSWSASALRWMLLILELRPDSREAISALLKSLRTSTAPDWFSKAAESPGENALPEQECETGSKQTTGTETQIAIIRELLQAQREILLQPDDVPWLHGRLASVAATIEAMTKTTGRTEVLFTLHAALEQAQAGETSKPLLDWLEGNENNLFSDAVTEVELESSDALPEGLPLVTDFTGAPLTVVPSVKTSENDSDVKFGRRAEDAFNGPKTLKVDQEKIDRLMALIGEMVVAKNSLPYLAGRAESQYGVRELSREIKTQYAVINRIAEEMQDAIMQVRMMPVSFIFQRFPRLVRDTSRKLNKDVNLILEGENTEADKNIVEALADPLIHIVRNSLDHGIELPEVRKAAGKAPVGRLTIRAMQESDRVFIEISDDGKGIDPLVVKQKAYEKGIIDEATMERLTDHEAINLVFAAGFSTVDKISDLSGRGVGMDVVRNAIEKVNGSLHLESEVGKGTSIRLSLPLSMAVTNVMIVEFDNQIFGVPMDLVVETVRVPGDAIKTIKRRRTTVLRERIVPLLSLNELLALDAQPRPNEDGELATLVVRINDEHVGILVDDFRETVDIILKPMAGILGGLSGYSGSALLGDGSVLMVLNPKELV